jgi:chromosome segregation ATPase
VIVSGFPLLIDRHRDEVADLRAELEAEREAIDEYPNAVAALEAIRAERADAGTQRDAAQAEFEVLDAQQSESEARLAALDERLEAQGGALETQIAALEGERGRLDELVRATSDDLQAAMDLLEAARGRMSQ